MQLEAKKTKQASKHKQTGEHQTNEQTNKQTNNKINERNTINSLTSKKNETIRTDSMSTKSQKLWKHNKDMRETTGKYCIIHSRA